MDIKWKVLAPSLERFQKWYVNHHEAFKKMKGLRVNYVLSFEQHFIGVKPPTVVVCLPEWETNPNYNAGMIKVYLEIMDYCLDDGKYIDWIEGTLVYCRPHTQGQD